MSTFLFWFQGDRDEDGDGHDEKLREEAGETEVSSNQDMVTGSERFSCTSNMTENHILCYRLEMTNKLQAMMQSHCSEALQLLQIGSSGANATSGATSELDLKQVKLSQISSPTAEKRPNAKCVSSQDDSFL